MNKFDESVSDAKEIVEISTEQLPTSIAEQFTNIKILEDNVVKSIDLAKKAKEKAQNAEISITLFNKKSALENLQAAALGLAEAQLSTAEAQKLSFDYQLKLSEIAKDLFNLGVSNIAANRAVVREIKLRLSGATDEELSDLARQELLSVISQLKAQEDMMNKQEQLSKIVKDQNIHLGKQIAVNDEQERKLELQQLRDEEHECALAEQAKKDAEHDYRLTEQANKDDEFDRILCELQKEVHEIIIQLNSDDENNKNSLAHIQNLISQIDEICQKQSKEINVLKERLYDGKATIKNQLFRVLTVIALIVSVVALVLRFIR